MESDNVTFYQSKIIKVTSDFNLKKTFFFARWRQHPPNSWNIFQMQKTPLFRRPQGRQRCLEKQNYPLSLNKVVWCAKIGPKTKKFQNSCQNTIIFDIFLVNSEVFQTFLVLGPILAHQSTKFQLNGWYCFSRHPWESWGRLNSGVAQELVKSVTMLPVLMSCFLSYLWDEVFSHGSST